MIVIPKLVLPPVLLYYSSTIFVLCNSYRTFLVLFVCLIILYGMLSVFFKFSHISFCFLLVLVMLQHSHWCKNYLWEWECSFLLVTFLNCGVLQTQVQAACLKNNQSSVAGTVQISIKLRTNRFVDSNYQQQSLLAVATKWFK